MNITQLHQQLTEMLANGCEPDTAVVIVHPIDGSYLLVKEISSPVGNMDYELWVTLFPSEEEADPRFTPAHFDSDPTPAHGIPRPWSEATTEALNTPAIVYPEVCA